MDERSKRIICEGGPLDGKVFTINPQVHAIVAPGRGQHVTYKPADPPREIDARTVWTVTTERSSNGTDCV